MKKFEFGQILYQPRASGNVKVKYCGLDSAFGSHYVLNMETGFVENSYDTGSSFFETATEAEIYYQTEIKPMVIAHHGKELRK